MTINVGATGSARGKLDSHTALRLPEIRAPASVAVGISPLCRSNHIGLEGRLKLPLRHPRHIRLKSGGGAASSRLSTG